MTAVSGILWGGIVTAIWEPVPDRAMDTLTAAGMAAPVIAVMCWLTGGNRRRQDGQGLALRTLADVIRPAARHVTGPLKLVREAEARRARTRR